MYEILTIAFYDDNMGQTQMFDWFLLIQKWGNFEWRLWVFRLYLYRSHRRKCGNSLQNCSWRQM